MFDVDLASVKAYHHHLNLAYHHHLNRLCQGVSFGADATSADFPRAVCRRKAMERSGGVVTPPHSAGMYVLFGFIFFGIFVAS